MSTTQSPAINYPDAVCSALQKERVKFSQVKTNDGKKLTLNIPAKNTAEIKVTLRVNDSGDSSVRTFLAYSITPMKQAQMLTVVNNLNSTYRYITLYLDNDGDICAGYDFTLCTAEEALPAYIMETLALFSEIVDQCIPELKEGMKDKSRQNPEDELCIIKTNLFEED